VNTVTAGPRESRGPAVVRPARTDDAEGIALVHTTSWQAAYRGLIGDEYLDAIDVGERTRRWVQILADAREKEQRILVADVAGQVRGFATGGSNRDADLVGEAEVYAIYVHPDVWGTGVGAALMSDLLDALEGASRTVSLWVIGANDRARTFYRRFGFADDGQGRVEVIGGADVRERRMVRSAG
jgi:ribosomal protein S18 acetylase RimI-like enzyme